MFRDTLYNKNEMKEKILLWIKEDVTFIKKNNKSNIPNLNFKSNRHNNELKMFLLISFTAKCNDRWYQKEK